MKILDGYRTYIITVIMIGLVIAKANGFISTETYLEINGVLVAFGLSTLRAGSKTDAKTAAEALSQMANECFEKK